jgi:hypothetical protein
MALKRFKNKVRSNKEAERLANQNVIIGEVVDVIENSDHTSYQDSTDVGTIRFNVFGSNQDYQKDPLRSAIRAKPLRHDVRQLPILGEFVVCVRGPALHAQNNHMATEWYYLATFGIWGERNENSLPNASFSSKQWYKNDTLGETFKDKEVSPLHHFEGDTIIQGRFDNSIRLGSTATMATTKDTWSIGGGSDGDPIMILTNEFAAEGTDKIEDINSDRSTIMMTSTQKIDVGLPNPESPESVAVPTGPVVPFEPMNMYMDQPQVIISSDRLVFNAKSDSVFISAAKEISLSTSKWKINVTALADILRETLNQLTMEVHPTPCGPSGTPINGPIYAQLLTQLESMLQ